MNDSPFCNRTEHNGRCCCPHNVMPDRTCLACLAGTPGAVQPPPQPTRVPDQGQMLVAGGLGIDGGVLATDDGPMPALVFTFLAADGSGSVVGRGAVPFMPQFVTQLRDVFDKAIATAIAKADDAAATDMECPDCKDASRAARRVCNTCGHTGRVPKPDPAVEQ